MIQMIAGIYGLPVKCKDGKTTRIKGMGPDDGPFSVAPEREAELVAKGIARYVEPMHPVAAEPSYHQEETADTSAPIGFDETPPEGVAELRPLTELSAAELREICEEYGLPFKANESKAKLIAKIEDFQEQSMDDAEDAPSFDASEAVL